MGRSHVPAEVLAGACCTPSKKVSMAGSLYGSAPRGDRIGGATRLESGEEWRRLASRPASPSGGLPGTVPLRRGLRNQRLPGCWKPVAVTSKDVPVGLVNHPATPKPR